VTLRFGTDGIRGVANVELTPELALAVGRAAARRLAGDAFLVGSDTRRSSPMLKAALAAGLAAEGRRVVDVDVLPTPGLAFLAASRAVPAAMVSASHNPFDDNGIKLLSSAGTKLPDAEERDVEEELEAIMAGERRPAEPVLGARVGSIAADGRGLEEYAAHLAGSVDLRRAPRLAVVCDCANGAASTLAPQVLRSVGLAVHAVAAEPNGTNINDGCGSTHPERLAAEVVARRADLGLAFDGDADRLIAVDHLGQVVDGDQLLALFALDLHRRGELASNGVVVTVMSNLGLRIALEAAGITVVETPVGDRYVADALDEHGFVLGGEQSGHIVFRRQATTGDGILTALRLVDLLARERRPLAELAAAAMVRLPQELRSVRVLAPSRLSEAAGVWREVEAVEARLGAHGRVVLRASGTEPAVRVMVEAGTHELARSCAEHLAAVVARELGVARR